MNHTYLNEAVRALGADPDEPLRIRFTGPQTAITISPVRRRDRTALVMPMRMERDGDTEGES